MVTIRARWQVESLNSSTGDVDDKSGVPEKMEDGDEAVSMSMSKSKEVWDGAGDMGKEVVEDVISSSTLTGVDESAAVDTGGIDVVVTDGVGVTDEGDDCCCKV